MTSAASTGEPDPAAPLTWLDEHGDGLYAYAMSRVGDADLAEELVQETLVAAIERWSSFAGRSTVRTWLVGILKNKVIDHYRRSARGPESLSDELSAAVVDDRFKRSGKWQAEPGDWGGAAGSLPESEEFAAALRTCLDKLPPRTAELFLLSERHGVPTQNLCKVARVSTTNLYVMLYRARMALRECLERSWFKGPSGKGC